MNLADSYQQDGVAANDDAALDPSHRNDPDPVITPPIYGRWHALTERLLTERDGSDAPNRTNWVHDLNLDPRWRTAAGFGTKVVQDNQETYMEAAWEQIGDVLEANRRIRQAQLAKLAGNAPSPRTRRRRGRDLAALVLLKAAPLQGAHRVGRFDRPSPRRAEPDDHGHDLDAMRRMIRPGGQSRQTLRTHRHEKCDELRRAGKRGRDHRRAATKPRPTRSAAPDDL